MLKLQNNINKMSTIRLYHDMYLHIYQYLKFMTNLRKLNVSCCLNIDNNGINNLNLEILSANNTPYITNVNYMTKLKKLSAAQESGISHNGIKNLNLEALNIIGNTKMIKI